MRKSNWLMQNLILVMITVLLVGCSQQVVPEEEAVAATEVSPMETPVPPEPTEILDPTPKPTVVPDPMSTKFNPAPVLANLTGGGPIISMAFNPDSSLMANSGIESILIWNLKDLTYEYKLEGHEDVVIDLGWSPDGNSLASLSADETLRLWAAPDYAQADVFSTDPALCFDWSPAGDVIAVGAFDGEIQLWDVQSAQIQATLPGSEAGAIIQVMWSPDGTMLATVDSSGIVNVWSVENQDMVTALADAEGSLATDLAWSPDGQYLATAHENGFVHLWKPDSWEISRTIEALKSVVTHIAWSPDSLMIATGGDSYSVPVWVVASGELIPATGIAVQTSLWSLVWSSNGKFLVVGTAGKLHKPKAGHWQMGGQDWSEVVRPDFSANTDAGFIYIYLLK